MNRVETTHLAFLVIDKLKLNKVTKVAIDKYLEFMNSKEYEVLVTNFYISKTSHNTYTLNCYDSKYHRYYFKTFKTKEPIKFDNIEFNISFHVLDIGLCL